MVILAALASHKASVETVQGNQWKRAGKLYSPRLSALWSWHRRTSLCRRWSLGCSVMNMLPTSQTLTPLFSPCRRYMKHKRDDSAEKQDEETVDVTPIMICVFVVMCCSMLVLLYFFYDHLGTTLACHWPNAHIITHNVLVLLKDTGSKLEGKSLWPDPLLCDQNINGGLNLLCPVLITVLGMFTLTMSPL